MLVPWLSIEEATLPINLTTIINYLESKSHKYRWEIVIINDGSKDKTGEIADEFANQRHEIKVIHHPVNLNLGHALQTGFRNSKGDDHRCAWRWPELFCDVYWRNYLIVFILRPYYEAYENIFGHSRKFILLNY